MLFFFIFSMNDREKVVDSGEFECPYCQTIRPYLYKEVRPYVSLYFIPLFPLGQGRAYVECEVCHNHFEADIVEKAKNKPKRKTVDELFESARQPAEDEIYRS